jgi:hypothetical protein
MININNADLKPQAADGGRWTWNGYEITHRGITLDGEPWQRKGQWQWVKADARNGWMATASVREINNYYKPKPYAHVDAVLNGVLIILAAVCVIAIGALMLL